MSVKDLYKMTKEELVLMCRRLHSENEELKEEMERMFDYIYELENMEERK